MFFKTGVVYVIQLTHPKIIRLLIHEGIIDRVVQEETGAYGARITSVLDGSHSEKSSHYDGRAWDLGVKPYIQGKGFNHGTYWTSEIRARVVKRIYEEIDKDPDIGPASDWFIQDEGNHIHGQLKRNVP